VRDRRQEQEVKPLSRIWALLSALLLILVLCCVYGQVVSFDFVNYDDPDYSYANPHITNGLSAQSVKWAFTRPYAANWIPLTWISHMLDYQILGARSGAQHLVNVFLHILGTLLLFLFLHRITGASGRSLGVAFLFALHPLHVESVAWIAERKDVLSGVFWFAALWAYASYARRVSVRSYLWVILWFICGLLSKPMMVTFPVVALLLDYWPLERTERFGTLLKEKIPLFALAGAASVVTFGVQQHFGAVSSFEQLPVVQRLANVPVSYATYLLQFLWPIRLAVFYPFPEDIAWWKLAASCSMLLAMSLGVWKQRRKRPYLLLGWSWFLVTLLPVIGLVQAGGQAHADRYMYIPMVGISIMAAWAAPDVLQQPPRSRQALIVAEAAAGVALVWMAWTQVGYWRDSVNLFEHALEVTDRNYIAYNNLGLALEQLPGRRAEAILAYRASLRAQPRYARAHYNLGTALSEDAGQAPQAVAELQEALRLQPGYAKAHNNLGRLLAQMPGRVPDAIAEYKAALLIDPSDTEARNNLGNALAQNPETTRAAVEQLEAGLRDHPDRAETHLNLGNALAQIPGRLPDAIAEYRAALRVAPNLAEAHNNLATALAQSDQQPAAIVEFEQAVRLRPGYVDAHFNLGTALAQSGRLADAVAEWRTTVRLDPKHVRAHYNLGVAFAQMPGRTPEAIVEFTAVLRLRPDPRVQEIVNRLRADGQ
jgi:protein O-mannosyl-transferase